MTPLETLPDPDAAYTVGKNKPPLPTRFKKGHPGGPGRPKGSKNRKTIFLAEMEMARDVTINGKKQKVSKLQLGYRQLANLRAEGNLKAIALSEKMYAELCGPEQGEEPVAPPLTDAELAILGRMRNG